MNKILLSGLIVFALSGCSDKIQYISNGKEMGGNNLMTMGVDRADFERAASEAVESLLKSGALDKKGGGRYVVAIGRVLNDTTQRIDTDLLTKKIRIALLNSGKAVITTAVSGDGPEETLIYDVREFRDNEEFKQDTFPDKGTIYSPDFALSGKIIQRTSKTSDGRNLVAYYFQLGLSDISSGLAFWEYEDVIEKIGSGKSVVW